MFSFKSNVNKEEAEILRLQELFIKNSYYRQNLEQLIENIKVRFNLIN